MMKGSRGKQLLVVASCVLLCVTTCACSSYTHVIPPSQEDISPLPSENQQVEYIAEPPDKVGKFLFSSELTEQQKENYWSQYRGKWVVWSGNVTDVIPKLKPSKVVFLYNYETPPLSFSSGEFAVRVNFSSRWTEDLKQLFEGETIHYRAKLVQQETMALWEGSKYKYGLGPFADLLELEDGEIIREDDVAARLADFGYASYEQLDELVAQAESVAAISDFYESKLKEGRKEIAVDTILGLFNMNTGEYWHLDKKQLPELRAQQKSLKSNMERHLEEALLFLHFNTPESESLRGEIEDRLRINNIAVEEAEECTRILQDFWEEEKQSAEPGISDLAIEALLSKLPDYIGVTKTVTEGVMKLILADTIKDKNEIIVGICQADVSRITHTLMPQIHDNVVTVTDSVTH